MGSGPRNALDLAVMNLKDGDGRDGDGLGPRV